jgi:hypothetical protein
MKLRNNPKLILHNPLIQPPIPFQVPAQSTASRGATHKLELRVNPADINSDTYRTEIQVFGNGSPEEWFEFQRNYKKVEAGQQLTTGPMRFATMRNLLQGEALRVFERESTKHSGETLQSFTEVMQGLTTYFLPTHALSTQKRFMRRYLLKPRGSKIREFIARLHELNAYLIQFPPFAANQQFSDEEIAELLEHSLPASWQRQMTVHGISSTQNSVIDIVEFGERLETLEEQAPSRPTTRVNHYNLRNRALRPKSDRNGRLIDSKWSAKPSSEVQNRRNERQSTTTKNWCAYHNTNGHDISKCKVMLDQAKKMRANWAAQNKPLRGKKPDFYKDYPGLKRKEMNSIMRYLIKRDTSNNDYITNYILPERKREQERKKAQEKTRNEIDPNDDSSTGTECNHMELFENLTVTGEGSELL